MYNSTPLDEAARSRNFEILQLLLSHGAVVDTLNDQGNSSHEAVRSRNLDVVRHLLNAGAGAVVNILKTCKPLCDAAVYQTDNISVTLYDARGSPWHKAVRSPKFCATKLTAVGFADLDHSPYFILLLKTLSELASWFTPGVWTFGNSNYWAHTFVKRLLVLLVLQWWSIPLRASIREVVGELLEGLSPRFFRKEAMHHVNFFVVVATFGVTLVTYVVTYQVTLPLTFNLVVTSSGSTSTRILLEVLLLLHVFMSLMMDLDRALFERV
jgi:hypothetical protein